MFETYLLIVGAVLVLAMYCYVAIVQGRELKK
jgi:hypothetical protein